MFTSVDVDRSGRFGVYCENDVYIYNLRKWLSGLGVNSGFVRVDRENKIWQKKLPEAVNSLDSIFMDECDYYSSKSSNIIKFGTHSRVLDSFISIQGSSIFHGTLEGGSLDFISNQMMKISSFDWSPHFSTGTFVTSCEDALIRVSDIRSKELDQSFISFYNTTSIRWNPLNPYLLGGLHENGEILGIYDLRMLKPIGIIPRREWSSGSLCSGGVCRRMVDFSWLPLSSDRIFICETNLLSIIDVPVVVGSQKGAVNKALDFRDDSVANSGVQNISLRCRNNFSDFDMLSFSSSSADEKELGEDGEDCMFPQEERGIHEVSEEISCEKDVFVEVNTWDFHSGTNNLIIHGKNGGFYYCNINNKDDLGLKRLGLGYNGRVKRIFSSEDNSLTLFGGLSLDSSSSHCYFMDGCEFNKYSFYITPLPSISVGDDNTEENDDCLTLDGLCMNWFYRDLNIINQKMKTNQQMASNLVSLEIESNGKTIAKLSRNQTQRGSFVMEDNTSSNLPLDHFDFTIILTTKQEKNTFKVLYSITKNIIILVNELYSNINLSDKSEIKLINSQCGQEFKSLQNYKYTSLDKHAKENNYMRNLIPVRFYVDDKIITGKEVENLSRLFGIELNTELVRLLFGDIIHGESSRLNSQLLDWVWIISSFPDLIFKKLIKYDGIAREQQLELISSTTKHVYGIGVDKQGIGADDNRRDNGVTFAFHTLERMMVSNGSSILLLRVRDDESLTKAMKYENLILEINGVLREIEYITEERFLYGDYFRYTCVLFKWLSNVLYNHGRRYSVKDVQNFSVESDKVKESTSFSMMLPPTAVHSYFKRRCELNASKKQSNQKDVYTFIRPSIDITYSSLPVFDQIDRRRLLTLFHRLYLEIINNYDARILVVAIQKFSNYLKKAEDKYQSNDSESGEKLKGSESDENTDNPESGPIQGQDSVSSSCVDPYNVDQSSSSVLGLIQSLESLSSVCGVCMEPVSGLYTRCLVCKHGGHIRHIKNWFKDTVLCPVVGCECECVPGS
ncbi:WD40 repeat and RING finger domain-containing protein [Cryptosporidium canis]|uniref:WD40 repeat and RING finger domain-containing protein n=1 Tax=Cryptosporidium canis TaxID=195482 RepID=A0ABQ8PBM2_9CRYT|nr:WD40 repeat and RING finger domain-containing protein [Cryptosporidium canis]KAJ1612569.1 WD40 repeat and RING finger domain-containing protein [Cryptosporidium canis]